MRDETTRRMRSGVSEHVSRPSSGARSPDGDRPGPRPLAAACCDRRGQPEQECVVNATPPRIPRRSPGSPRPRAARPRPRRTRNPGAVVVFIEGDPGDRGPARACGGPRGHGHGLAGAGRPADRGQRASRTVRDQVVNPRAETTQAGRRGIVILEVRTGSSPPVAWPLGGPPRAPVLVTSFPQLRRAGTSERSARWTRVRGMV